MDRDRNRGNGYKGVNCADSLPANLQVDRFNLWAKTQWEQNTMSPADGNSGGSPLFKVIKRWAMSTKPAQLTSDTQPWIGTSMSCEMILNHLILCLYFLYVSPRRVRVMTKLVCLFVYLFIHLYC